VYVTVILVVFPTLMFLASIINWPGGGEAPCIEVAPAAFANMPESARLSPASVDSSTINGPTSGDSGSAACPHVRQGTRGGCCGSNEAPASCPDHTREPITARP
jgi:hypothetical protein